MTVRPISVLSTALTRFRCFVVLAGKVALVPTTVDSNPVLSHHSPCVPQLYGPLNMRPPGEIGSGLSSQSPEPAIIAN